MRCILFAIILLFSHQALSANVWSCQSVGSRAAEDCRDNQLGGCQTVGVSAAAACYLAYLHLPKDVNPLMSCEVKSYEASRFCSHNIQEGLSCSEIASSFYGMCNAFSTIRSLTKE